MDGKEPTARDLALDLELVRRARTGDARARRELGERLRCLPRILHVLNRRRGQVLDAHELEDLSQDAVITVLEKLDDYHGQAPIECWVHRIAFYELMNRLRSKQRHSRVISSEVVTEDRHASPRERSGIEYEHVESALKRLDPAYADIVRMKQYEGLTFNEIARALNASPNTIKARYYHAIGELASDIERSTRGRSHA